MGKLRFTGLTILVGLLINGPVQGDRIRLDARHLGSLGIRAPWSKLGSEPRDQPEEIKAVHKAMFAYLRHDIPERRRIDKVIADWKPAEAASESEGGAS